MNTAVIPLGGITPEFAATLVATLRREQPTLAIAIGMRDVELRSEVHSRTFMEALWWGALSNQVLVAKGQEPRERLIGYLLS